MRMPADPSFHRDKESMDLKRYDRLIFVSNGDTALGPMAEAILQSKFLLDVLEVTSRGAVVLFPEPINPKAEAVLAGNGLTMKDHVSAPLLAEDFDERTLILATDESVKQKLQKQFGEQADGIRTITEFVGDGRKLSDPYGGGLADYGVSFAELNLLIGKLVLQLNEEELLC